MSDHGHLTPRPCQNCKDKDAEIERLKAVVDAVIAHRDNEDFYNIGTWNDCVRKAEAALEGRE